MPVVNSEAMAEHLREISTQVAPSAHAVLVLDGAGWHQAGERLPVPDNISMLPLPPYAPELNPVENIWQFLRGNFLSHQVWNSYDEILAACRNAWNKFMQMPEQIASIDLPPSEWSGICFRFWPEGGLGWRGTYGPPRPQGVIFIWL